MELATKALALACAACMAVAAVLGWRLHSVKADVLDVQAQLVVAKTQLAAAQAAQAAASQSNAHSAQAQAVITQHEDKANAALHKALEAAPDWSNDAVPDAVLDSLHDDPAPARSADQAH